MAKYESSYVLSIEQKRNLGIKKEIEAILHMPFNPSDFALVTEGKTGIGIKYISVAEAFSL